MGRRRPVPGPHRLDSLQGARRAFRSNFIVGYPGETEDDHDRLLDFIAAVELDWCGFFEYSREDGTYAADLDGVVDPSLIIERLAEVQELQDSITARKRAAMVGAEVRVLVDAVSKARSCAEAPEIDGIIEVPPTLPVGEFVQVRVVAARGPDLEAVPVEPSMATR
jgi:ribosomal protein S12 methylthiotransferase